MPLDKTGRRALSMALANRLGLPISTAERFADDAPESDPPAKCTEFPAFGTDDVDVDAPSIYPVKDVFWDHLTAIMDRFTEEDPQDEVLVEKEKTKKTFLSAFLLENKFMFYRGDSNGFTLTRDYNDALFEELRDMLYSDLKLDALSIGKHSIDYFGNIDKIEDIMKRVVVTFAGEIVQAKHPTYLKEILRRLMIVGLGMNAIIRLKIEGPELNIEFVF